MKCKQCGEFTETKAFATFRTRKGEMRRRSVCKECRNNRAINNFEKLQSYRKEYNSKNKSKRLINQKQRIQEAKDFVNLIKTKPCTDCGQSWPPVAMDFDHINGDKVKSISRLVGSGYKLDLIKIEIEKCELVCACCHRLRTAARGENIGRPMVV